MPDGSVFDPAEELEDLWLDRSEVKIGRRTFSVRLLGLHEFGLISKALNVAVVAMGRGDESDAYVAEHIVEIIPLIAIATDKTAQEIEKYPGGAQLALFAAVMRVNRDFFVRCADFKFGGETAQLVMGMLGHGPAPSTTSAAAATPNASATPPPDSIGS